MEKYKTMPHSIEAEQSVLGSMMIDNEAPLVILSALSSDDLYSTANREIFESYLWQVCGHIVALYVDSVLGGRKISESDRHIIIQYLKAVSFGIISQWLQSGLRGEIRDFYERIYELKKGTVEEMIQRLEENKNF